MAFADSTEGRSRGTSIRETARQPRTAGLQAPPGELASIAARWAGNAGLQTGTAARRAAKRAWPPDRDGSSASGYRPQLGPAEPVIAPSLNPPAGYRPQLGSAGPVIAPSLTRRPVIAPSLGPPIRLSPPAWVRRPVIAPSLGPPARLSPPAWTRRASYRPQLEPAGRLSPPAWARRSGYRPQLGSAGPVIAPSLGPPARPPASSRLALRPLAPLRGAVPV